MSKDTKLASSMLGMFKTWSRFFTDGVQMIKKVEEDYKLSLIQSRVRRSRAADARLPATAAARVRSIAACRSVPTLIRLRLRSLPRSLASLHPLTCCRSGEPNERGAAGEGAALGGSDAAPRAVAEHGGGRDEAATAVGVARLSAAHFQQRRGRGAHPGTRFPALRDALRTHTVGAFRRRASGDVEVLRHARDAGGEGSGAGRERTAPDRQEVLPAIEPLGVGASYFRRAASVGSLTHARALAPPPSSSILVLSLSLTLSISCATLQVLGHAWHIADIDKDNRLGESILHFCCLLSFFCLPIYSFVCARRL